MVITSDKLSLRHPAPSVPCFLPLMSLHLEWLRKRQCPHLSCRKQVASSRVLPSRCCLRVQRRRYMEQGLTQGRAWQDSTGRLSSCNPAMTQTVVERLSEGGDVNEATSINPLGTPDMHTNATRSPRSTARSQSQDQWHL